MKKYVLYVYIGDASPYLAKIYMESQEKYIRDSNFLEPEDKLIVIPRTVGVTELAVVPS